MRSPFTFLEWKAGKLPPKGWDFADAFNDGWTPDNVNAFMRATAKPYAPSQTKQKHSKPAPAEAPRSTVRQVKQTQQEQPANIIDIRNKKAHTVDDSWQMQLIHNDAGKPKPKVTKNWALLLENHEDMKGVFAYDAFKMRIMLMRRPPWGPNTGVWEPRSLQDTDYAHSVMWLESMHLAPTNSSIVPVIQTVAYNHTFDRLTEYLEGIEWDGEARIGRWLHDYMGCEDTDYNSTVGFRYLISAVARGLSPGCKVDTMPIFEGLQGALKSSALRALFGEEFFTDHISDIGSKDALMEMQGVWGIEIAEMHRLSASDANQVKKFLTTQTDRFRPPYGRSVIDAPRRVVLAGTINPEGNAYLKDPTGARRFWPVEVSGIINHEKIKKDRDQLWAEAVDAFKKGLPWWVQQDEQEYVANEQAKRTDIDIWTDTIAHELRLRDTAYQADILQALGISIKDANHLHAARIGRIVKKLGWEAVRERQGKEDRVKYVRSE